MRTRNALGQPSFAVVPSSMKCFIAAIIACILALAVSLALMAGSSSQAFASVRPVDDSSQAKVATVDGDASVSIEDDAVPLASTASHAKNSSADASAKVPVYWVIAGGIVVVAAIFSVALNKMNANIREMDRAIR